MAFVTEIKKMESWLKEGSSQFSVKYLDRRKYITVVLLRRVMDDDKDLIYCIFPTDLGEKIKPFGYYFKKQHHFICTYEKSVTGFRFDTDMQKEVAGELPWFDLYKDVADSFIADWEKALKEYFGVLHRDEVLAQQESRKKEDYTDLLDNWYIHEQVIRPYNEWLRDKNIHYVPFYGEDENMNDDLLWMYITNGSNKEALIHYLDASDMLHRVKYNKMAGKMGTDIYTIRKAIGDYFELKKQFESYKPSEVIETAKRVYDCIDQATNEEDMPLTIETDKGIYTALSWNFRSHVATGFNFRTAKLIKKKGKSKITAFGVSDILKISLDDAVIYEK